MYPSTTTPRAVSLLHSPVSDIDEPATEGSDDIVPGASFTFLGGADIECWGARREHKTSAVVWQAVEHTYPRGKYVVAPYEIEMVE